MLYWMQHPAPFLCWKYLLILFIYFYHYTRLSWKAKKPSHKSGSVLYHMLLFRLRLTFSVILRNFGEPCIRLESPEREDARSNLSGRFAAAGVSSKSEAVFLKRKILLVKFGYQN